MKGLKAPLIILAMTAGLLALVVGLRAVYPRLAAEHLRRRLETVPDDRAAVLLDQVAELGEAGIPVLVEALGSQRESVARAGKKTLCRLLHRWQIHGGRDNSRKQAVLAESLATRAGGFGHSARGDAADLATQILLWLPDPEQVDRSRVIASCQKVFRLTSGDSGRPAKARRTGQGLSAAERVDQARRRPRGSDGLMQPSGSVADGGHLPGGGLPISTAAPLQQPSREGEIPRMADTRAIPPQRPAGPPAAEPPNPLRQPGRLWNLPEDVRSIPDSRAPTDPRRGPQPAPIRRLSLDEPAEALPRSVGGDPAEVETVDLMRRLRAEDRATVRRAEAELTRRGFQPVHLELARWLFDPDPRAREQLARLLPRLQSVDAIPWLLWLARDANAEVRLVAITLLATTGDPGILQQVEQLARQDPDPRVRDLAVRVAKRPGGKPR